MPSYYPSISYLFTSTNNHFCVLSFKFLAVESIVIYYNSAVFQE